MHFTSAYRKCGHVERQMHSRVLYLTLEILLSAAHMSTLTGSCTASVLFEVKLLLTKLEYFVQFNCSVEWRTLEIVSAIKVSTK